MGVIVWRAVAHGESFRSNCLKGKSPGGNCPGGNFMGGSCPRGELVRGNCPGRKSWVVIVLGGISWGQLSTGHLSRGELSLNHIKVILNLVVTIRTNLTQNVITSLILRTVRLIWIYKYTLYILLFPHLEHNF